MKLTMIALCGLLAFSCRRPQDVRGQVQIEWTEDLKGDFAFANEWDYPEGVYRNDHGQLSCDGFCPPEADAMKDSSGHIDEDSLSAFYALVDTTHRFHSLQSEGQCDEYAGTDYMRAYRSHDTVFCYSLCNAATHCSLHLRLHGDDCLATVELHSIVSGSDAGYFLQKGFIRIDRRYWERHILKAMFDLDFGRDTFSGKPVTWKGRIYAPIMN